jgi:hypothetical protein
MESLVALSVKEGTEVLTGGERTDSMKNVHHACGLRVKKFSVLMHRSENVSLLQSVYDKSSKLLF